MNCITLKNLIPESKKLYGVTIEELLDEFLKFEGKTLIMFDLETLGLNPKYEYEQITEVAAWAIRG
jgi:DNA polymerase III epsilon subunit-like protein